MLIISLVILCLIIIYGWYVSIISKQNKAKEALSGIDVQLKQRANIIPNILTIAKKFMEHEKSLLAEITQLRTDALRDYDSADKNALKEHFSVEDQLSGKMGQLMINMEAYPELKSDQTMLQAQRTYNEIEAKIAAARRFYNSSVTALNNSVQIFPGNLIASMIGATVMPFYEADEQSTAPINASEVFK
ncbi:LemA family protein [Marinicellulosiphila megalodicopiae]|uniref:LemA family protein n=1 Tax=Marinicellulosiphila megalodicopiae TaxID=2724896 RepID=UPI003BB16D42